jgi:GH18 family chitinase
MPADFHGSWDATTGVNSPLWDGPNDPESGWSVDGCVKNWVSRGAPQDKLNIGLAFYGRSFKTAQELGVTHGGADYSNWNIDEGTPQYFVSHFCLSSTKLAFSCVHHLTVFIIYFVVDLRILWIKSRI